MTNKDRSKQDFGKEKRPEERKPTNRQGDNSQKGNRDTNVGGEDYRSTDVRNSPMMAHLIEALESGQDIGHYGQLVFVMVGRFFLSEEEMLDLLQKQPGYEAVDARKMLLQVKERGYNPPKRERIIQWQAMQDFPICLEADDPNGCNVYRELKFPDEIYDQIDEFWEEKVEAEDDQE